MRISDLPTGSVATIVGFAEDTPLDTISRLRALGFILGTELTVQRRLPLGGPMVICLGGSAFALEPAASSCIHVTHK